MQKCRSWKKKKNKKKKKKKKKKKNAVSILKKTCDLCQEINPWTQMDALSQATGKTENY